MGQDQENCNKKVTEVSMCPSYSLNKFFNVANTPSGKNAMSFEDKILKH